MPYALEGKVVYDFEEGAIEITEEQYAEAIEGVCSGLVVTIEGGFAVIEPPPPPEPEQPEPTEPEYQAAIPYLVAAAQFTLADGDIASVDICARFGAIFMISPGLAWAFFEEAQDVYTWNVNSTQGVARVTDGRTPDYVEIELKDNSGEPLQSGTIALQIYKVFQP